MRNLGQSEGLQLHQDLAFQRRSWKFQRIGWIMMALFVLAGIMGLLGPGLLSHTTISTPTQSLQVEYDRLIRLHASTRLKVQSTPTTATVEDADRIMQIQIRREYLEQFQIAHILPEPEAVLIQPTNLRYDFLISKSDQPISITIDLEPKQIGWIEGEIGLSADTQVQFKQWVYP